jgi:hypothetical protein
MDYKTSNSDNLDTSQEAEDSSRRERMMEFLTGLTKSERKRKQRAVKFPLKVCSI